LTSIGSLFENSSVNGNNLGLMIKDSPIEYPKVSKKLWAAKIPTIFGFSALNASSAVSFFLI